SAEQPHANKGALEGCQDAPVSPGCAQAPPGHPHGPGSAQAPPGHPQGPDSVPTPGSAQAPPGHPHGPGSAQAPPGHPHGPGSAQAPPGHPQGPGSALWLLLAIPRVLALPSGSRISSWSGSPQGPSKVGSLNLGGIGVGWMVSGG
uniref:Uncharacterized protein n=1 Tax=Junco hyemalis TaxID=40217 RepID=A0A8C5JE94_JUNHY